MRPILLDHVDALGHAVFEEGEYNLNIIGIRSKDHKANSFDDRMCVVFTRSESIAASMTPLLSRGAL